MITATHVFHLARRFLGSLDPRPPPPTDREWVRHHLSDPEFAIWAAMSNPDQRHSIEVARAVDKRLSGALVTSAGTHSSSCDRSVVIVAALMHDSGKNVSGLGTPARVAATLLRPLVPRSTRRRWSTATGPVRRLADYWRHPELGGRALTEAGSDPMVIAWTTEHHRPPEAWSIPHEAGRILRDCDND